MLTQPNCNPQINWIIETVDKHHSNKCVGFYRHGHTKPSAGCPKCRYIGFQTPVPTGKMRVTKFHSTIENIGRSIPSDKIESRKRIAFCAPGLYRGQILCQFSCFLFFVFSTSWKSPKVIVFECWHLHGPSQIDSEHIWNFSWKHVFWGFRGHFDVILKSILRRSLMFIVLFDLKLLMWSRTMFLKHELCLRFSFRSIFNAWCQIGRCCSTNLR